MIIYSGKDSSQAVLVPLLCIGFLVLLMPVIFLPWHITLLTIFFVLIVALFLAKGCRFTIELIGGTYKLTRTCWGVKYETKESKTIGFVGLEDDPNIDDFKPSGASMEFAGQETHVGTMENMKEIVKVLSKYDSFKI